MIKIKKIKANTNALYAKKLKLKLEDFMSGLNNVDVDISKSTLKKLRSGLQGLSEVSHQLPKR